jgi:hypothetical protein
MVFFASARIAEAVLYHAEIVRHGFQELLGVRMSIWLPFRAARFELFKLKLDWFFLSTR